MKWIEISGIQTIISNEENQLVKKIQEQEEISSKSLNERENELARKMTSKGILNRINKDDIIIYTVNEL